MTDRLAIIQNELLQLLKAFDALCSLAGCNYSLVCGTLLGAVRHQGFIPWDDDADVVMFRDEFEKLYAYCCAKGLVQADNQKLYIDSHDTWVPRLRMSSEKATEFVDIFILDKVPPNQKLHSFNLLRLRILQGMMKKNIVFKKYRFLHKLYVGITHFVGKLVPVKKKFTWYTSISSKYKTNMAPDSYYISNGAYHVLSIFWQYEDFSSLHELDFENTRLKATVQSDLVLRRLYGNDYMTPPPENERVPNHIGSTVQ